MGGGGWKKSCSVVLRDVLVRSTIALRVENLQPLYVYALCACVKRFIDNSCSCHRKSVRANIVIIISYYRYYMKFSFKV